MTSEFMYDFIKFDKNSEIYSLIQQLNDDDISYLLNGCDIEGENAAMQNKIDQFLDQQSKKEYNERFISLITDVNDDSITACYIVKSEVYYQKHSKS